MEALKNKQATLIDLRNQDELNEFGSIEKAIHIPLKDLPKRINEIKTFSKPIILFCKAGARAEQGKLFLESQGLSEVYNAGGYSDVREFFNKI